jgi:hypothetical protein
MASGRPGAVLADEPGDGRGDLVPVPPSPNDVLPYVFWPPPRARPRDDMTEPRNPGSPWAG